MLVYVNLPKDVVLIGAGHSFNSTHATVAAMQQEHSPAPRKSAEPVASSVVADQIKEVERLWRSRTKTSRECKPIPYTTMKNAQTFLDLIAVHTPVAPEVYDFPNGEIEFEWETDAGSLSVLLDERSIYSFFKSQAGRRRKSADPWDETIPHDILVSLGKLFLK